MKSIYLSYSYRNSAAAKVVGLLREVKLDNTSFFNPFDHLEAGADWSDTLQQEVIRADALIAFTQVSSVNVHFEAGCAFGARKPILVVADSDGAIPYPFRNSKVLVASTETDFLVSEILSWVDQIVHREEVQAHFGTVMEMLQALESDPPAYTAIHPVEFDRAVIAGLLASGLTVEVPRGTGLGDFGFDAIVKAPNGEEWAMEIRKLRPMSKSSISDVHRLVGAAAMRGVSRSILVSPTGFTESTKTFVVEADIKIQLIDAKNLVEILRGNLEDLFKIS